MNFINKKYNQLAPIEEYPKEKETKKQNIQKPLHKNSNENKPLKTSKSQKRTKPLSAQPKAPIKENEVGFDARDHLWDNNYKIKVAINQFNEENSKLKSKIGNFEVFIQIFTIYKMFRGRIKCFRNNFMPGNCILIYFMMLKIGLMLITKLQKGF